MKRHWERCQLLARHLIIFNFTTFIEMESSKKATEEGEAEKLLFSCHCRRKFEKFPFLKHHLLRRELRENSAQTQLSFRRRILEFAVKLRAITVNDITRHLIPSKSSLNCYRYHASISPLSRRPHLHN